MKKSVVSAVICVWMLLIGASYFWNALQIERSVTKLAHIEALSHFEKDQIYRRWGALHGGVYVPPTAETPPNPYLKNFKNRDVITTGGMALTLVNPAYMTRQVHELAAAQNGVRGHITSINPIRPENRPDDWEMSALQSFERGQKEALSTAVFDGEPFLRFMRPLMTEEACLKCHQSQGYKVGDVRGGISITVPLKPFIVIAEGQRWNLMLAHLLIAGLGLLGIVLAAVRLKRFEDGLRDSEYRWRFAIEGSGDGVWDWNVVADDASYSTRWKTMLGYAEDDILPNHREWVDRIHPDDRTEALAATKNCLEGKTSKYAVEYRLRCKDESYTWVLSRGIVVKRDDDGSPMRMIGTHTDISERKAMEDQVQQLAYYDPLTQLPNRRLLNDRLNQALLANERSGCHLALMFLDLDNFKPLNDTHGHEIGDLLLKEVALRISQCTRKSDTVARFGGDEFVVLIKQLDIKNEEIKTQAALIAEKIRVALATPYRLNIRHGDEVGSVVEHRCTVSIGVVLSVDHQANQNDILRWADKALYQAKASGRDAIRFFQPVQEYSEAQR